MAVNTDLNKLLVAVLAAELKPVEVDTKKARELAEKVDVAASKYWEFFDNDAQSNTLELASAMREYAHEIGIRSKKEEAEEGIQPDRPDPEAVNLWEDETEELCEEYALIQNDLRDLAVRVSEITEKVTVEERDQYGKEELESIKKRELSIQARMKAACKKYFPNKDVEFPDFATVPSDIVNE